MLYFDVLLIVFTVLTVLAIAASPASARSLMRAAMVQMRIEDNDLEGNMRRAEEGIRKAAKEGADFVCLPEAADWGWLYQESRRDAFTIPGKYTDFLAKLAKELNVWVSAGCLEKDGDKTYNSAVIIDRIGKIVLKHRKINTLPELTSHLYDAGRAEDIKVVDTEFGKIGLTICADNFSIENPKKTADLGAWLLIAPHGFAAKTGTLKKNSQDFQNHIKNVAGSTGMWVIGADSCMGRVGGGIWKGWLHSGCSTIADPKGEAVVVGRFLYPDVVVCDIPVGG